MIRLLLFVATGAFLGQLVNLDRTKWIMLGRGAFLTFQNHQFDKYIASTRSGAVFVVFLAIFALGLGALFEGIAFAGDKILHLLVSRKVADS
jgi:hypothetical protein